jgi:CheY-like chemotaxis protein
MNPNTKKPGRQIVVVEDNADARDMLKELLELDGHTVRVAGDGEAAVREIIKNPPEIALVDIGLPTMDGFEVARRVRQALPQGQVRLIALTGYGFDDPRASSGPGFDAHLMKPVGHSELRDALEAK